MSFASSKTTDKARMEAHHKMMTQMPVPKLVVRQAIPAMISSWVTMLYNTADTYFVSQLGTSAAGAVGVVFALMAVLQAVGYTLGMGAGNIMSRQLGAMENEKANRTASTAVASAFFVGLLFALFGNLFVADLMRLLGATETILPYAQAYGTYILYGAPFMCASFVMGPLLRCEGKNSLGTIGLTTGGLLNIALDPLFIFTFGLGTAGAAIATALSQFVSFCILFSFFLFKKSNLRLRFSYISRKPADYGAILYTGLPTLSRQGLSSISTLLLNRAAMPYGDAAIAAMGIVGKVYGFVFSTILGFLQGYQPVVGFNFGAKKYGRVKQAARFSGTVCLAANLILAVVCFLLAPQIMALFRREDAEVIAIGAMALRCRCLVLPMCAISTLTNFSLQSTGQALRGTVLSMCRQGIFFIPLILILPGIFGLTGVLITQTISDLLTLFVTIPLLIGFVRLLNRKESELS